MGSPCSILLRGADTGLCRRLSARMEAEIGRLERAYSRFLPDSVTSRINAAAGTGKAVAIDEETSRLLDYADTCYRQSGGLFDITSGSLRQLWNYRELQDSQVLPDQAAIEAALDKIGWDKVVRTGAAVALPVAGMEIDFGGIVKEYAADCVAALAEAEDGVGGMAELGGDIRVFGVAAAPWRVGIRDPRGGDAPLALITLAAGALATSGDYERYSVIAGKRYSHILNPLTGWPVTGLSSVSVLAPQCIVAGSAASIAMLMGEGGEGWLRELGLPYLCVDGEGRVAGSVARGDDFPGCEQDAATGRRKDKKKPEPKGEGSGGK